VRKSWNLFPCCFCLCSFREEILTCRSKTIEVGWVGYKYKMHIRLFSSNQKYLDGHTTQSFVHKILVSENQFHCFICTLDTVSLCTYHGSDFPVPALCFFSAWSIKFPSQHYFFVFGQLPPIVAS
jgi:hypothetical protein